MMKTQILRAAIAAMLTSLAGYAYRLYRERKARDLHALDKAAIQEWETDGGGNPHARRAHTAAPARSAA